MPSRRTIVILLAILAGIPLGMGLFTFSYGEGLSYFSHDPRACTNCHIMQGEFDSWQKGPHHAAAACVDCHLPEHLIPKLIAKSDNGYRHSKGFTFEDFHEPILIKPRNAEILQENCLRCHGEFVHEVVRSNVTIASGIKCVHCHWAVGHGAQR